MFEVGFQSGEAPATWRSVNLAVLPGFRALTEWPRAAADVLEDLYLGEESGSLSISQVKGRVAEVDAIALSSRTLDAPGSISERVDYVARDDRGISLLMSSDPNAGDLVFDPPALVLPSALDEGSEWSSAGSLGEAIIYETQGRVVGFEPVGDFDDCLVIETDLTILQNDSAVVDSRSRESYCAGIGLVESIEFDADGNEISRSVLINDGPGGAEPEGSRGLPSAPILEPPTATITPDWALVGFGRAVKSGFRADSTIPPTWIGSSPPVVLAAGYGGDLTAFNVGDEPGAIEWTFRTGGTIYGPPAVDQANGRLFFGSSDKHLYALDARGLFLWSEPTSDNIESRPLLVGDLVVFGSEDRNVYALDSATGEKKWKTPADGAVVSSPIAAGDVVAIGSDGGHVYGLDPATGDIEWTYEAGAPVEAPLVAGTDSILAASRSGEVAALDPGDGKALWVTDVGSPVRSEPVLGGDEIYVVTTSGELVALDSSDGEESWRTEPGDYSGPPLLIEDTLLVATQRGTVDAMDLDGDVFRSWAAPENTAFNLGPTSGGDAAWLADNNSFVYRLGPLGGGR